VRLDSDETPDDRKLSEKVGPTQRTLTKVKHKVTCDRIIAPRQPQMAHAIGFPSREVSLKKLVFGTVLRAVFSGSAMGFCAICSMRLLHELRGFSSQLQLVFPLPFDIHLSSWPSSDLRRP
jgi:hypothetical protein